MRKPFEGVQAYALKNTLAFSRLQFITKRGPVGGKNRLKAERAWFLDRREKESEA